MAHGLPYLVARGWSGSRDGEDVEKRSPAVLLVVEDDRDMRSLLCDELWDEGYQLREAANGDEALVAVLKAVPDLIITDLKMPAGGVDYVNRLRTFAPQCPIILMTAFGDTKTKEEALKSGATAYFDKPVRLAELKITIKELLEDHEGNHATEADLTTD
ncbi:MAG TPA: response regulator [Nitrospiraceae bacterium]|nr:response regulator [Nitrospiraceae bacterium]